MIMDIQCCFFFFNRCECYDYLLNLAVDMKKLNIPWHSVDWGALCEPIVLPSKYNLFKSDF